MAEQKKNGGSMRMGRRDDYGFREQRRNRTKKHARDARKRNPARSVVK